jgi:hypothetical protein
VAGGALLGLGVALKLNAGLVALGPAWELRRRPARLALTAGIALAVVAVGYAVVGPAALEPVTRTSKSVSNASFWKLVQGWLQSLVGTGSAYRGEIQVGSLLVLALVAWSLFRLTSRRRPLTARLFAQVHEHAGSGDSGEHGGRRDGGDGDEATVVALVLVVAYLFASPYVLPWYDGLAFGLLALVAASTVDRFMVVHLIVLSLAYLPARVAGQPPELEWLRTVVRGELAPWALLALTAALVVWTWRAAGRVRKRPASGAPRP